MTQQKKKRGRPPGASRLNAQDFQMLNAAAIYQVAGKATTPTAAFRNAGATTDNDIRRLRRKWDGISEEYLNRARQEVEQKKRSSEATSSTRYVSHVERALAFQKTIDGFGGHQRIVERALAFQKTIDGFGGHQRIVDNALAFQKTIDNLGGAQRLVERMTAQQRALERLAGL